MPICLRSRLSPRALSPSYRSGPLVTDNAFERAVRLARLQVTEATFEPIPFDAPAARAFARVAVEL
jgi:hypothetical protein